MRFGGLDAAGGCCSLLPRDPRVRRAGCSGSLDGLSATDSPACKGQRKQPQHRILHTMHSKLLAVCTRLLARSTHHSKNLPSHCRISMKSEYHDSDLSNPPLHQLRLLRLSGRLQQAQLRQRLEAPERPPCRGSCPPRQSPRPQLWLRWGTGTRAATGSPPPRRWWPAAR